MNFKLLFNQYKIQDWKHEYFRYSHNKKILKHIANLNKSIAKAEINCKKSSFSMQKDLLKFQIKLLESEKIYYFTLLKWENKIKVKEITEFFHSKLADLNYDMQIIEDICSSFINLEEETFNKKIKNFKVLNISDYMRKNQIKWTLNNCFRSIYEIAIWLKNFIVMNGIACDNILEKCDKIYTLEHRECLIKREDVNDYMINFVSLIDQFKDKVISFYADVFCTGNKERAERQIISISPLNILRKLSTKVFLTLYALIFITYFLITYTKGNKSKDIDISMIEIFFPAFNFSFMVYSMFLGLAFCVVVFRYFRINYIYLLEIDPSFNLDADEIFTNIFALFLIWGILVLFFRICVSYYFETFKQYLYVPSILILGITFSYVFWPFKCFLYKIRKYLFKIFLRFIFPFGRHRVRFKDAIYGLVMSSFSRGFTSLSFSMCLLACLKCRETNQRLNCNTTALIPAYVLQVIPFVLLACQAFNLTYYQKVFWPQFANGFRFVSSVIYLTFNFLYAIGYIKSIYPYIFTALIAYIFNVYWDFCVCWNLFQKKSKNFMLRDKLIYPKWFYYFAIVYDLLLRGTWVLRFFPINWNEGIMFGLIFFAVNRRVLHTLIRVENESINNPEKYRKFLTIPDVM